MSSTPETVAGREVIQTDGSLAADEIWDQLQQGKMLQVFRGYETESIYLALGDRYGGPLYRVYSEAGEPLFPVYDQAQSRELATTYWKQAQDLLESSQQIIAAGNVFSMVQPRERRV